MPNASSKIFIIGLPRTGTTSLCASFLSLGYKVAHTAYTENAFKEAQVIADTPVFHTYQYLDKTYPHSKFIYLDRNNAQWIPSIKRLLNRMYKNVVSDSGGFNPMIKAAYTNIFSPFSDENINDDVFLQSKYQAHQQAVWAYFKGRKSDFLTLNLTEPRAWENLCEFLGTKEVNKEKGAFPHHNIHGKVTAWNDIHHPLKVASTHKGRIDKLAFAL